MSSGLTDPPRAAVRLKRRQANRAGQPTSGGCGAEQRQWRRPKVLPLGQELFQEFVQRNNSQQTDSAERVADNPKLPWIQSYRSLVTDAAHCPPREFSIIREKSLPVTYWFYIYTHSGEIDLVLRPFGEPSNDRRLISLMKKCQVLILLKDLELYKSLPRRLIVIKAPDWGRLVVTLSSLEAAFPSMMRYASYPVLMQTDTYRFPCDSNHVTCNFTRAGTFHQ